MEEVIDVLKKKKKNKWVSGIVPGLLFHSCLSIVYCWSLVKIDIDSHIFGETSWAFSIMIFMLALTAIFSRSYVEKHTKDASRYGAVLFSLGMIGSGLSCQLDSLNGLYFFFGICLGIGAGLIYDVPLKIISKWFKGNNHKTVGKIFMVLSTLSSFFMVPFIKTTVEKSGIVATFTIFGIISLVTLMIASWLLEDPEDYEPKPQKEINHVKRLKKSIKDINDLPGIISLWFILFLNLSGGLAVISCERDMMLVSGFSVILGIALSRMSIPIGKGIFGKQIKKFEEKNVYKIWWGIYSINLLSVILSIVSKEYMWISVILINLGYGASFAIQPRLISGLYGKRNLERIHVVLLTAWAASGLFGNQISEQVYSSGGGPKSLMVILGGLYIIGFGLSLSFKWSYKLEKKK